MRRPRTCTTSTQVLPIPTTSFVTRASRSPDGHCRAFWLSVMKRKTSSRGRLIVTLAWIRIILYLSLFYLTNVRPMYVVQGVVSLTPYAGACLAQRTVAHDDVVQRPHPPPKNCAANASSDVGSTSNGAAVWLMSKCWSGPAQQWH